MSVGHRQVERHAALQPLGQCGQQLAVDGPQLHLLGAVDALPGELALQLRGIAVRDLTGALRAWIDVGAPDAARLHRASKAAPRVAVYTHHDPERVRRAVAGERIHRAESVELYAVDRELLAELAARLDRRMTFDLSVTEGHLYVTIAGETLAGEVVRLSLVGN